VKVDALAHRTLQARVARAFALEMGKETSSRAEVRARRSPIPRTRGATRGRRANLGFEMFGRAHAPQISLRLTPFPLFAALVHWSGALSVAEAQRKAGTG
jgi:hypothetical protein